MFNNKRHYHFDEFLKSGGASSDAKVGALLRTAQTEANQKTLSAHYWFQNEYDEQYTYFVGKYNDKERLRYERKI